MSTRPLLLNGHDAKLCARRIHNHFDDSIPKTQWEPPADLQMRFDDGRAFETTVFEAFKASLDGSRYVDLSGVNGKANAIAATNEAMDNRIEVVLGGWLPDDTAGGRTGRPDILIHDGGGRYAPGDVKAHRVIKVSPNGNLTYSLLSQPAQQLAAFGKAPQTTPRLDDYLQLAHYWRMLEAAGRAPHGNAVGFLIGTDNLADLSPTGLALTWVNLAAPAFETYSRSAGSAKRTALERYDHEQGFRLKVATAAAEGTAPLVQPIFTDECNSCPWFDYCRDLTGADTASAQIISGRLSVREWRALAAAGIVSVQQLADVDVDDAELQAAYLPEVTHVTAQGSARGAERLWLDQLEDYMGAATSKRAVTDALAYCVVISDDLFGGVRFRDYVEKQRTYFHPVVGGGWPTVPPNFLAFRWGSAVRQVNRVLTYEIAHLADRFPGVAEDYSASSRPPLEAHIIYSLGPDIPLPPGGIPSGPVGVNLRAQRFWVLLDQLLTQPTVVDARDATKELGAT